MKLLVIIYSTGSQKDKWISSKKWWQILLSIILWQYLMETQISSLMLLPLAIRENISCLVFMKKGLIRMLLRSEY